MTNPPPSPGHLGTDPSRTGREKNWMGVVALITALLCGLQIFGLIFGILGSRAAKRGEASNRGMSLFAVWWSAAWILLTVAALVWFLSDPDARSRDLVRGFGSAGADVAAIDEAIHEIQDAGGSVTNIGWDGENYYVGDIVVPAESGNPDINYYINGSGHCIEISSSSSSGALNSSSNASLSHGTACSGTPQPVLTP